MKRLLTLFCFLFGCLTAFGQIRMTVSGKAELVPEDADAISYYRQTDANDNVCAIIKVTPDNPLSSRLVLQTRGGMAPVAPPRGGSNYMDDSGEWWYWISPKVTNIMFTCDGYTPTDWIGVSLQPGKVYRLDLSVESSYTIVKQFSGAGLSGIKMTISPEEALVSYGTSLDVMINSVPVTDGYFDASLSEGKYFFKIESEFYETYTTEIAITKGMKEVEVSLKPAFGHLNLSSNPSGADVFVDGKRIGSSPIQKSDRIAAGEHTVLFRKADYYVAQLKVKVKGDGSVQEVPTAELRPQFGQVTLLCADPAATLIVTDPAGKEIFRGKSGATVRLNSQATYKLEASKPSHMAQSTGIVGQTIEGKEVDVRVDPPVPIYGGLQISSTPSRAEVYIDEAYFGTTLFAQPLLIGSHLVELRKEGYKTYTTRVLIEQDQTFSLDAKLVALPAAKTVLQPATPKKSTPQNTAPSKEKEKKERQSVAPDRISAFAGAVVGYDPVFKKATFGGMAGVGKVFGAYVKGRSDFKYVDRDDSIYYLAETASAYKQDGSFHGAIWTKSGEASVQHRWVVTAGATIRIIDFFSLYAGAGYGVMNNYWMGTAGDYVLVKDRSRQGGSFEIGGLVRFGHIGISMGVTSTNGYMDGEAGLQYYF